MGQPIYEKSAINLLKDFANQHLLNGKSAFNVAEVRHWRDLHYPELSDERIKTNLLILSTNSPGRRQHSVHKKAVNDFLFANHDGSYRLFNATDPSPLRKLVGAPNSSKPATSTSPLKASKPNSEREIQQFYARNLSTIEAGLTLHQSPGVSGTEYLCGTRRIDILARDAQKNWVVIELKADKGHERVLGQIALYVEWIKQNVASPGESVRGIILAQRISTELRLAAKGIPYLSLKEHTQTSWSKLSES